LPSILPVFVAPQVSPVSSYPQCCRGLGAKGLSPSYLRTRGLPLVWGHNQIRHDKEDVFTLQQSKARRVRKPVLLLKYLLQGGCSALPNSNTSLSPGAFQAETQQRPLSGYLLGWGWWVSAAEDVLLQRLR